MISAKTRFLHPAVRQTLSAAARFDGFWRRTTKKNDKKLTAHTHFLSRGGGERLGVRMRLLPLEKYIFPPPPSTRSHSTLHQRAALELVVAVIYVLYDSRRLRTTFGVSPNTRRRDANFTPGL
ncbi:hypothetical protein, unlikely [Trypanosoma brucei gambiense DAL972]|uniref:Uncharacterized protein n=1 Tax=Trypanosoma brucei gambiense (strain MHOM/CI/86/DAL972) TaxID=679716 RepID=D0A6D3_TRYB9|nr:hypothetical protein, unlikely [Trypanosoma brucei gambiense DAL972]CBH17234.1 hypothetical protein, unlikely [Trypanosoma brucei gambiense DAL972]|eukprot:XP_011779498.1 hypothetical protein, unlikely [Trypanosoma brucei gambiense DAL972]